MTVVRYIIDPNQTKVTSYYVMRICQRNNDTHNGRAYQLTIDRIIEPDRINTALCLY